MSSYTVGEILLKLRPRQVAAILGGTSDIEAAATRDRDRIIELGLVKRRARGGEGYFCEWTPLGEDVQLELWAIFAGVVR